MKIKVKLTSVFNCTLERAFKTPLLCDITKIHTGYGLTPRVTHCTGDENWGQPGSAKNIFVAKSLLHKGGLYSVDKILRRIENSYWLFEVSHFQSPMFGFTAFTGEWVTTPLEKDKILVTYTYTLHANRPWFYPFNWLFAKTFWFIYMKRVIKKVKHLAYNNEPYLFP